MGRPAVASKVFEIGRDHVCDSQATTNGSRSPRRSLRLREAQDPLTIRVFIIVGQDDRAIGSAQVLGDILAFADIAPLQPRAGAAGELAVAEMQISRKNGLWRTGRRLRAVLVSRLASPTLRGIKGSSGPIRVQ